MTHHARVYLNGELLASHECGFLPFEVELTEKLQPGENLLTVAVSNIIDYTTLPVGGKADMMGGMMGNAGEEENKSRSIIRILTSSTTPESTVRSAFTRRRRTIFLIFLSYLR